MSGHDELSGVFADLDDLTKDTDDVRVGDAVRAIEKRGVGPFFLVAGVLVLLVGSVPGLPAIAGFLIVVVSAQLLVPHKGLWLPRRIKRMTVQSDKIHWAASRARAGAARIEPFVTERLTWVIDGRGPQLAIGLAAAACGVLLVLVGFVPGLPIALALPLIVIGIALTANDGVWAIAAAIILIPAAYLLVTQLT